MSKTPVKATIRKDGVKVRAHERRLPASGPAPAEAVEAAAAAAAAGDEGIPWSEKTAARDLRTGDIVRCDSVRCDSLPRPVRLTGWATVVDVIEETDGSVVELSLYGLREGSGELGTVGKVMPAGSTTERLHRPRDPYRYMADCANCEIEASLEEDDDTDISPHEAAELVSTGRLCPVCANNMSLLVTADNRTVAPEQILIDAADDIAAGTSPWQHVLPPERETSSPAETPQPPFTGTWGGVPTAAVPCADLTPGMAVTCPDQGGFGVITAVSSPDSAGQARITVAEMLVTGQDDAVLSVTHLPADGTCDNAVPKPPYDRAYADWRDTSCGRCTTPAIMEPPVTDTAGGLRMLRDDSLCAYCVNTVAAHTQRLHAEDVAHARRGARERQARMIGQ